MPVVGLLTYEELEQNLSNIIKGLDEVKVDQVVKHLFATAKVLEREKKETLGKTVTQLIVEAHLFVTTVQDANAMSKKKANHVLTVIEDLYENVHFADQQIYDDEIKRIMSATGETDVKKAKAGGLKLDIGNTNWDDDDDDNDNEVDMSLPLNGMSAKLDELE